MALLLCNTFPIPCIIFLSEIKMFIFLHFSYYIQILKGKWDIYFGRWALLFLHMNGFPSLTCFSYAHYDVFSSKGYLPNDFLKVLSQNQTLSHQPVGLRMLRYLYIAILKSIVYRPCRKTVICIKTVVDYNINIFVVDTL